jgi:hypothetical protein
MVKVLTNPIEIKQFLKQLVSKQIDAYFARFKDDSEMLLAVVENQAQAEQIETFLRRSRALTERRFLDVAVQPLPGLAVGDEKFPLVGVFYVSGHLKKDRARVMNHVLGKLVRNLIGKTA